MANQCTRKSRRDNRSNQLNPNHGQYWKVRGYSERPNDWNDEQVQDDDWVPDCDECGDSNDVSGPDCDGDYYCSYCELYVSIDDDGDSWVPACNSCDEEDVSGPDEDGDYYCGYCDHYIDDDGDCIDDDNPSCSKCGDSNDVSDPGGDYYWCSHCDHDIDSDGDCVTDPCLTCDDEGGDDEYEQEVSNTNLPELVEDLLLRSINRGNWVVFNQQQMKSISGVINQVDITLRSMPQNGREKLYISCIGTAYGPFEADDIDSIQRMWAVVGVGRKIVLLESGVELTPEVLARAEHCHIEIYQMTQPLPPLVLSAIR